MEEMLTQLLEGQKQLFESHRQLFEGQKQIFNRLDHLDNELTVIKSELATVKSDVTAAKSELTTVKSDVAAVKYELATVKSDMASKTQQNENNQFIGALLHRTEELNALVTNLGFTSARLEGMLANTATKDDIADLAAQLGVVNERIFRQETEIRKLKIAK